MTSTEVTHQPDDPGTSRDERASATATGATGATRASGGSSTPVFFREEDAGDDLAEALRSRTAHYRGRDFRAQLADEPFRYRYLYAGDERLVLQSSLFTAYMQGEIPFPRQYIVMWFRRGSARVTTKGHTFSSVGADPFLVPAEDAVSFEFTPRHSHLVRAGVEFLEQTATERHGGPPQRIAFDHTVVPSPADVARWRTRTADATRAIVDGAAEPLLRLESQLTFVRGMLDLFPWRAVDVPRSLRTERGARVRQAAEYIHAHADEAITPTDMADAVGVHTRTLQLAMNEHFGMSPTAYLRQVRLERVHEELVEAGPGDALVWEVARRWGFGNLGRFSAVYAGRFGEYPSETLGR